MAIRHFRRLGGLVAAVGVVSACQIPAVQHVGAALPDPGCSAIARRIMIEPPAREGGQPPAVLRSDDDTLLSKIDSLYANAARAGPPDTVPLTGEPVSNSMLFLSGGSQNGAFGAGVLSAWAATRHEGLPRFRVITGISTGALQSTFAFIDRADRIREEYEIPADGRLLHPFTRGGLKSKSLTGQARGGISLLKRGAIAELEPLRERLHAIIDDETLQRVAAEAGTVGSPDERLPLVGAVEMDSGDAYAFNLTEAARRYVDGDTMMRDCYIEALMASSSVPMAALPVFIDGRMYIDGGARFGVIADFTLAASEKAAARLGKSDRKNNLFVLVNGTLEAGTTCHLRDCRDYPLAETPEGQVPEHGPWTFTGLALRSISILINTSYRASVDLARREGEDHGFEMRFARIEDDYWQHSAAIAFLGEPKEELTCRQWYDRDTERDEPVEFHPRFMRCLIDYGSKRKEVAKWAEAE